MINPITPDIYKRIRGISYPDYCPIPITSLNYLELKYWGFDQMTHTGEMIANRKIASILEEIFDELYHLKYPVEKMLLIDEYNGDDEQSMEANNSSCFNYRFIDGTNTTSKHSYGLAVDINPKYNPYIRTGFGDRNILPGNATAFADRQLSCPYYIRKNDICYQLFTQNGFIWGGDWNDSKDYQHFEYHTGD